MKILLISVCNKYLKRIKNIVQMLDTQKSLLIHKNIVPIFLYGNTIIETEIPYDTIKVDVEEKYTNLYKKLYLGYKHIYEHYNFEYIIKIDDDTFLNIDLINNIGRLHWKVY